MITITNNLHNTEVSIRANIGDELTINQIKRSRMTLCGITGCCCGGALGHRGTQVVEIEEIGHDRVKIEEIQ